MLITTSRGVVFLYHQSNILLLAIWQHASHSDSAQIKLGCAVTNSKTNHTPLNPSAWLAVSSCLGDEIRAQWSGRYRTTPVTYGRSYTRGAMSGGYVGQGEWEGIEMANLAEEED